MEEGTRCGRSWGVGRWEKVGSRNTVSLWVSQFTSVPLVQLRRDGWGGGGGQMDAGTKRDNIYRENITSWDS